MSIAAKVGPSRLGDIAGAANVTNDPAELAAYTVDGKTPAAAVRPGTAEELAEVVKFAAAEKLALIATGARTKLGMGLPPRAYDVAVDMTRMDRVVACDPGDLTVSVEAGIPLHKLAATLREHRQFLPLSVPYASRATVGGTVASGVDTPLRQFYGTARDYLLGVEYVTGEGVRAKSGGRVVKNVSGYDLHKLMIGAMGTLGIMTRLNFRTFTMPAATQALVARFASVDGALKMRHRMAQNALTPQTLDLLSPRVAELFLGDAGERHAASDGAGGFPADLLSTREWAVTTGFSGNERVLARYAEELTKIAREAGSTAMRVLGGRELTGAFSYKRELIPIALDSSPATTIVKMSVLPMRMKEAIEGAARIAEGSGLKWAAMARGIGVIYVALLPSEKNEDARRRVVEATEKILQACGTLEGNATVPWCPAEWKGAVKVWGLEQAEFPMMAKLKNVFDAPGVLSPGRFMGGL
jgi:glycolate oxidase FAD binding subunit